MELLRHIKARHWPTVFGYGLFIGMMAAGYYYNITFIQLGLVDLGTRVIGMSKAAVAGSMAWLALITCLVGLLFGLLMQWRGWGMRFVLRLRLAFAVIAAQTLLTALAPALRTEEAFFGWVVATSLALGVGVPVTFSLTLDLIPVRDRGYAAGMVTALAYFVAEVFSTTWTIDQFAGQMLLMMVPGVLGLGGLAFLPLPFIQALARQHTDPAFALGRFVRNRGGDGARRAGPSRHMLIMVVLMFGVYFVDSLGFLRLITVPAYFETAWQSPIFGTRLFLALMHVLTALIAGVLYNALNEKELFLWIFGIFALSHLMYSFHNRLTPGEDAALAMPMLYVTAVSLYTVLNFAVWADLSTPRTISLNAALGVALSGWTATFISTAIAIQWEETLSLGRHLNTVDAIAMLFFLLLLGLILLPAGRRPAVERPPV
ncbi:MAG: MFS transporter [Anaerolineae bacterium]|nr:MFS transporter [Anaerolineae bacterium]